MSITSMNARVGMAEKLSIQQLTKAVQDGTVPSFIGIPLIQEKMKEKTAASAMQAQQPPVAQQVLQQAMATEGVQALPSNMPQQYAQGGILHYAEGDLINDEDYDEMLYDDQMSEAQKQIGKIRDEMMSAQAAQSAEMPSASYGGIDYAESRNPQVEYRRTPTAEVAKVSKGTPSNFESIALARGKAHGVDENLVRHVMHKETGGLKDRANAVSPAGAIGVMQLMPRTAKELGVSDPYNPEQNIEGGVKYLAQLQRKYQDPRLTAIAYNWGPGNTDKWLAAGADPSRLPRETRGYIQNLAEGGIAGLAGGGAIHFQNRGIVSGPMADPNTMNQIDILGRELDESRAYLKSMKMPGQRQLQADPSLGEKYNAARDRMNALQQGYENLMNTSGMDQAAFGQYRGALGTQPPQANPMVKAMSAQPVVTPPVTSTPVTRAPAKPYDFSQFDAATDRYMKERETQAAPVIARAPDTLPDNIDAGGGGGGQNFGLSQAAAAVTEPETTAKADPASNLEKLLTKREAGMGRQRDIDNYMALLSAGLGMMGGTSPFAGANIGQGAQQGINYALQAGRGRAADENALLSGRLGLYKYQQSADANRINKEYLQDYRNEQIAVQRERIKSGELGKQEANVLKKNTKELEYIKNAQERALTAAAKAVGDSPNSMTMTESQRAEAIRKIQDGLLMPDKIYRKYFQIHHDIDPFASMGGGGGTKLKFDAQGQQIK